MPNAGWRSNPHESQNLHLTFRKFIRAIDALSDHYGTRSALIEQAVRDFLATIGQRQRERQDVEILNLHAEALNEEAADVLSYQVEL